MKRIFLAAIILLFTLTFAQASSVAPVQNAEIVPEPQNEAATFSLLPSDFFFVWHDESFTKEQKADIEAEVIENMTQFYKDNAEIIQQRIQNAHLYDAAHEAPENYLENTENSHDPSGGLVYTPDGSVVPLEYDIHTKGSFFLDYNVCVQHNAVYLSQGQYACVYDRCNVYACSTYGHVDCYISEYAGTYTGLWFH